MNPLRCRKLMVFRMITIVVGTLGCGSETCEALLNCEPFTAVSGEICANGVDDNKDTRTDCADPECESNYHCISPTAPTGFTGYYSLRISAYSNEPPASCADGSSPVTFFSNPSKTECSLCECDVLEEPSCAPPPATCWFSENCGGSYVHLSDVLSGHTCQKPQILNTTALSCRLTSSTPNLENPGSCTASGGVLLEQPWQTQIHACPPAGTGCPSAEFCLPRNAVAASAQLCILGEENNTCPPEWPKRHIAFRGASDDTRACSPCECTSRCDGGGYQFHSEDGCSGTPTMLGVSWCSILTGSVSDGTWSVDPSEPTTIPCSPSGGEPSGGVIPQDPVIFCCTS